MRHVARALPSEAEALSGAVVEAGAELAVRPHFPIPALLLRTVSTKEAFGAHALAIHT